MYPSPSPSASSSNENRATLKIHLLIAEDHLIVREGLATLLSFQPDMEVVGLAKDGVEVLELLDRLTVDVVLLDLVMPRQDGLATIPLIKAKSPSTRVLVLTSYAENERVYGAIKSGADGYLLKDATPDELLKAIRDVAKGEPALHPSIAMRVIKELGSSSAVQATSEPLTPRELETLRLIAQGFSNQEIAQKLVVQERTVAKYVSNILNKLHLANRTQVALYAIRKGLTEEKKP
ncbi:MAG: response regulator transcription factor [Anaerolineales bacterium]|nr:response regulator transcription factor [Anaerolineales bacterium]MCX7609745.1 response regulator transcription factor [Anaerolineales bacterium]